MLCKIRLLLHLICFWVLTVRVNKAGEKLAVSGLVRGSGNGAVQVPETASDVTVAQVSRFVDIRRDLSSYTLGLSNFARIAGGQITGGLATALSFAAGHCLKARNFDTLTMHVHSVNKAEQADNNGDGEHQGSEHEGNEHEEKEQKDED